MKFSNSPSLSVAEAEKMPEWFFLKIFEFSVVAVPFIFKRG